MNKKNKTIWIITLVFVISAAFFAVQFFQGKHINYYFDRFAEGLSFDGATDVDMSDENIIRYTGNNPYIVYSVPEQGDYLNGKVIFSGVTDQPLRLYIFYSDDLSQLQRNKKIDVTVNMSSDYVYFSLPKEVESVKYIRIDFKNTMTNVPAISYVGLQHDSMVSRFISFLLGIIYDRLFMIPIMLLILFFACEYFLRNWKQSSMQRDVSAVIILTVSFFLLYFDYLIGDKTFVFNDVANDSVRQTYPNLVSTANRIANGIWKEYINFQQSLGNREEALVLGPGNWFTIFGKSAVLRWVGIGYYIKVLLAGILAYFWGRTYSGNSETSLMIAFGYAMSSEFTARGGWYSYSNVAFLLILWLLAFELHHRKGRWYLLPIATVTLFYCTESLQSIIWGLLLAFYILFRELADGEGKVEWKKWLHTELLYGLFAVLGMADTLVAQLAATLSSNRFTNASSNFSLFVYGILSDRHIIFTAFLRTIGQTITGVGDEYTGWYSLLEGPVFYCGILVFLLLPIAIYNLSGRKRLYYVLAILAAGLYMAVPLIRVLSNALVYDSFKFSSYWICIFMLILSMEILTLIFSDKELKKGSIEIFQGTAVATVILLLAASRLQYIAYIDAMVVSILFIVIYIVVMQHICQGEGTRKKIFLKSLCLIFAVETIVIAWPLINDRVVVNIDDMPQKRYYNDYTVNAVDAIAKEDDGWYRVEKSYESVGLCDSLVQNYYGVESYIGRTEADPGIIAIYKALELPRDRGGYHHLFGTDGNVYASSLLGVKYYLSKDRVTDRYGLQQLFDVENVSVYENKMTLPLVYTYGQAISETDFDRLSVFDRNRNILSACVVDSPNAEIETVNPSVFDFDELAEYQKTYERSDGLYQINLDESALDASQILIIRMVVTTSRNQQVIDFLDDTDRLSSVTISFGAGEKVLEVSCDGLQSVSFPDEMSGDIDAIAFYVVDAEQYYTEFRHNVADLQSNSMKITAHDEIYNYIEGTVRCEQPRVLATSIPASDNWSILVDGQQTEVITVNKGFVGCYLDSGDHDIVIYYDGKSWLVSNCFKIIGFIASLGVLLMGIYMSKKE